jgi:predicted DNA-binding transcriptional regulator AlpA
VSLEHAPERARPERFLTRKQMAAAIGVSEQTIWRMTVDGRLEPPILINSRNLRWRESALARFRLSRRVPEYAGIQRGERT